MSEQPEALRLADALNCATDDDCGYCQPCVIAAELRRLHAENERLHQINQSHEMKLSVRGYELQIEDLKAAVAELLETLRDATDAIEHWGSYSSEYFQQKWDLHSDINAARAAIARAEGKI